MAENLINPPKALYAKIIRRIRREERLLLFKRAGIFGCSFFVSAALLLPALKMLADAGRASGFFKFLALLISDYDDFFAEWKNFSLVLLETAPVAAFLAFAAVAIIFLISAFLLLKDINTIKNRRVIQGDA